MPNDVLVVTSGEQPIDVTGNTILAMAAPSDEQLEIIQVLVSADGVVFAELQVGTAIADGAAATVRNVNTDGSAPNATAKYGNSTTDATLTGAVTLYGQHVSACGTVLDPHGHLKTLIGQGKAIGVLITPVNDETKCCASIFARAKV